jgi:uncharacterized protein YndB with AHSA1/START domain
MQMPSIRRNVNIATAPRTVWNALTTAEGLTSWLVDEARVDARMGGRVVWTQEGDDGSPVQGHGTILKWRPTASLEITWDKGGAFPMAGCRILFNVARDGDETRLALVLSGPPCEDPEQREALDTEWGRDLRAIQSWLDAD